MIAEGAHKGLKPVFLAGATGYVAGRLIPMLLKAGYRVRAMGRSLGIMACRPGAERDGKGRWP